MSAAVLIKTLRREQTELLVPDKELHAITVSVCPQMCEAALNRLQTLSLSRLQMRMLPADPLAGSCGGGREKETIKHGVTPSREAMCFLMRYQHTIHVHFTHEISSSGAATNNFLFGFCSEDFFFSSQLKVKAKKLCI